jgi:hypothetical protein
MELNVNSTAIKNVIVTDEANPIKKVYVKRATDGDDVQGTLVYDDSSATPTISSITRVAADIRNITITYQTAEDATKIDYSIDNKATWTNLSTANMQKTTSYSNVITLVLTTAGTMFLRGYNRYEHVYTDSISTSAIIPTSSSTVTLNKASGSGGSNSVTAVFTVAMPSATAPTRNYYNFQGYYDEASGAGVRYYTNAMASSQAWDKISSTANLYAYWIPINYTLTYHLYKNVPNSITFTIETPTFNLVSPTSYNGHTFDGWYTTNGYSTTFTQVGLGTHEDKHAYGRWFCTISYNGNGSTTGTGPSPQTSYDDTSIVLQNKNTLVKPYYTFNGWNQGTTTGTLRAVGYSFDPTNIGHTTFYANWIVNKITVTLDPKGGSIVSTFTNPFSVSYGGSSVTLPISPNITKTNVSFREWNNSETGTGTSFTSIQSSNVSETVANTTLTLYARWNATLSFNVHGGSLTVPAMTQEAGTLFTLPSYTGTKTGYTYDGWSANDGGTVLQGSQTISIDTIYHAIWTANTYLVALTAYNSSMSGTPGTISTTHTTSVNATYDSDMPTLTTAPTRTGYSFAGYYNAVNKTGQLYYNADKSSNHAYNKTSDHTLYAGWNPITYTVHYNGNGSTNGNPPGDRPHTYDATDKIIDDTTITRSNYEFYKWSTNQAGSTGTGIKEYDRNITTNDNLSSTANATVNLYAKWKCTITYVLNGPSGTPPTATIAYNSIPFNVPSLPNGITYTDHIFGGWNTQIDGSGNNYSVGTSYTPSGTAYLYAKWTYVPPTSP